VHRPTSYLILSYIVPLCENSILVCGNVCASCASWSERVVDLYIKAIRGTGGPHSCAGKLPAAGAARTLLLTRTYRLESPEATHAT